MKYQHVRASLLCFCVLGLMISSVVSMTVFSASLGREIRQTKAAIEMAREAAKDNPARLVELLKGYLGPQEDRLRELRLQQWSVYGSALLTGLLGYVLVLPSRETELRFRDAIMGRRKAGVAG